MIVRFLNLARIAVLLGALPLSGLGAGLSITPNVVTNDAIGQINVTISGVSGQTVLVEKFYDLNGNASVDAEDLLMQSFRVTDGLIPTLGGVTNLNVPGDADGTVNGQIQVQFDYPGRDSIYSRIEGLWLYRASSPTNAFTAVTQQFQVWQKTLSLSISGSVSNGVNWLTNALVVAFDSNFTPAGGARVQSNGRYTIFVPAGDYTVWPLLNGFTCDRSGASGTVRNGQPLNNANLLMTAGSTQLSGRIKDSITGVGLAGIGIIAYQSNNLFTTAFTDADGNYSLGVTPNLWEVVYNSDHMTQLGYVPAAVMPSTNLTGNLSGFDIPVTQATTLIYGTVFDDQVPSGNLTNVTVSARDTGGLFSASSKSGRTNGRYAIGVVAGNWWIAPDGESLLSLGCLGAGTNWVTGTQQPARIDILSRKITAHIRGTLLDDTGYRPPYATVQATDSTGQWSATATTELNGQFDLGVFAGTWNLSLEYNTAIAWYANGASVAQTVSSGQNLTGLTYRMRYSTGDVYGTIQDENGDPVVGAVVQGVGTNQGLGYAFSAASDNTGSYYASAINGPWILNLKCFGSESLTLQGLECAPATPATITPGSNFIPPIVVSHLAAPQFSNPVLLPGGTFATLVSGPTNRTFQVLNSSNLTDWFTTYVTNTPHGNFQFSSTNTASSPPVFFRALVQ
jgi:hypothetical protein